MVFSFGRTDKDGHDIVTGFNVYWSATLSDYDGAPDAKGPNSQIGHGTTELAAVAALLEKLEAS